MSTPDRLVTAGGVVVGLGGALGVAYYIYSLENDLSFWSWQGVVALVVTGLGLILLVAGLLRCDTPSAAQRQRGGKASTNYQAGRDMTIGRSDDADG
ncbi:hypothetical protein F8O07_08570 [Pseudoclavibacter sp. CFCC 13796]|uniref:hypothetical protein n=1 Tax=Pseudoclavibacter sp. CFCC 13796 TaxID=2615179 RepID=UPI0013018470|nr:hypothetical protein [Pseudoclavibacter sp. CFCC 13796]KAB1661919.1 hypothetical protein F8O07_08570 [Pseudoclavibacter sp. CFCC 13796]